MCFDNLVLSHVRSILKDSNIKVNKNPNFRFQFFVFKPKRKFLNSIVSSRKIVDLEYINGFLNFNVKTNLIEDVVRSGTSNKGRLKGEAVIEYTSFNPTGLPHLGNLHIAIHGSVFSKLLGHIGLRMREIYYVNDMGKQVETLLKGIREGHGDYVSGFSKDLLARLRSGTDRQVVSTLLGYIIRELRDINIEVRDFIFESNLDTFRKRVMSIIYNRYGERLARRRNNSVYYRGLEGNYFLTKESLLPTYFLGDLALQYLHYLRGLRRSYIVLGRDHYGHGKKLKEILGILLPGLDLRVYYVGKININWCNRLILLSKRKNVEEVPESFRDNWRFISLALSTKRDVTFNSSRMNVIVSEWSTFLNSYRASFEIAEMGYQGAMCIESFRMIEHSLNLDNTVRLALERMDIHYLYRYAVDLGALCSVVYEGGHRFNPILGIHVARVFVILRNFFGIENVQQKGIRWCMY